MIIVNCRGCGKGITENQVIVGFPVIRIVGINKFEMTGRELLYHELCFASKLERKEVKIELAKA